MKIKISINGKSIPVNPFVALFMINSIKGMIKSLKGVSKINKIKIEIVSEANLVNPR